jgi:hypothetical protein
MPAELLESSAASVAVPVSTSDIPTTLSGDPDCSTAELISLPRQLPAADDMALVENKIDAIFELIGLAEDGDASLAAFLELSDVDNV